jgi:hypothetical protein
MEGHVYSGSWFWLLTSIAGDGTRTFLPFFFLVGCLLWLVRSRSTPAYIAVAGAALAIAGRLTKWFVPEVRFIGLGKELQPLVDQNAMTFFFYMYATGFGLLLIAIALIGAYFRHAHA